MTRLIATLSAMMLATPLWAAELGDDGLYKAAWMRDTFKDLGEDLAEANAEGKRLMLMVEQRGCVYCKKMHEEVFPTEVIDSYLRENYFVVQLDLNGAVEMTDFDGEVLEERAMVKKWGLLFTPTMMFLAPEVTEGQNAAQAAVAVMPGAFGVGTTLDMLTWVVEERYLTADEEDFQRYHARRIQERNNGSTD